MSTALKAFEELLEVADRLMGPGGCPWDHEQTNFTLRQYILEEVYEMIEAIDKEDDENLIEEMGDLFYNLVFLAKIAEKEGRFEMADPIRAIHDKLINRHPHVFGNEKLQTADEVKEQWVKIKHKEKQHRTSKLDGLPPHLPALARAYKVADMTKQRTENAFQSEEQLAQELWSVVCKARSSKLNPEVALRKLLMHKEDEFRKNEATNL